MDGMKRVSKDISDFCQKAMADLELDLGDWTQENIGTLIGKMFNISDMSQLASMFGGFDASRLSDMLGGVKKGTMSFDPFVVLGLDENCSNDELKERYRELMATMHPDRTQGKTNFLASLINVAYEQICKQRGIK